MKHQILSIAFSLLTLSFGVLALVQDKMFAVGFALACLGFMAYLELSNKK